MCTVVASFGFDFFPTEVFQEEYCPSRSVMSDEAERWPRLGDEFTSLLMSFCPDTLLNHLDDTCTQSKIPPSRSWYQRGACMLVDISGFTRLSGELCSIGDGGLDQLRQITSGYLSSLLHLVYANGGDVLAFAGDALICVFLDDSTPEAAEKACSKAVICGHSLKDLSYANKLQCHIAVSYGMMCFAVLEGKAGAKSFLMNGVGVHNLSSCIDDASASELVICKESFRNSHGVIASYEELESANYKVNEIAVIDREEVATNTVCYLNRYRHRLQNLKLRHFAEFIPQNVIDSYYSGSFHIFGELREITTVFLRLDNYTYNSCSDLMALNDFFMMATTALTAEGGYLRQFLVDDKGCVLIALWGAPSASYDSNAERALNFSSRVLAGSKQIGHSCSAGITTGTAYYGSIGSALRRDVVAIGSSINFAARLMSKAKGCIFIDAESVASLPMSCRDKLELTEPLVLKGFHDPVIPYALKKEYLTQDIPSDTILSTEDSTEMRRNEMIQENLDSSIVCQINDTLERLEADYAESQADWMKMRALKYASCKAHCQSNCKCSEGGIEMKYHNVELIVVEGDKCSGKTEIAKYFYSSAVSHKLRAFIVTVSDDETTVPYSTLVRVFMTLLNFNRTDTKERDAYLEEMICKTYVEAKNDAEVRKMYFQKLIFMVSVLTAEEARCVTYRSDAELCPNRIGLYNDSKAEEVLLDVILTLMEISPVALAIDDFHHADLASKSKLMKLRALKAPSVILFTQRSFAFDEEFCEGDEGRNRECLCGAICVCRYKYRFNRYGKIFVNEPPSSPQKRPETVIEFKKQDFFAPRRFKLDRLSTVQVRRIVEFVMFTNDDDIRMKEMDIDRLVYVIRSLSDGNPHWVFAFSRFAKGRVESFVDEYSDDCLGDTSSMSFDRSSSSMTSSPSEKFSDQESVQILPAKTSLHLKNHVCSVMNSLTVVQSTTLKYASVLGSAFSFDLLHEFLPDQLKDVLTDSLSVLESLMLIKRSSGIDRGTYHFVTTAVRQIIYDLIPPSDVKLLHEKLGAASVSLGTIPSNVIAYHYFMAYSGPAGETVRGQVSGYALKAALDEVANLRFAEALEYFHIAEMTSGDHADSIYNLLKCVRQTITLLKELTEGKKRNAFMFLKDARRIVFGSSNSIFRKAVITLDAINTASRFGKAVAVHEMMQQYQASETSMSSETSSEYCNLEEYILLSRKLDGALKAITSKSDVDVEGIDVNVEGAPMKITACCQIS